MKVVMLAPLEPSGPLEAMVTNPVFAEKVQYIKGNPLSTKDLLKAKVTQAHAVFVTTSQYSKNPVRQDVSASLISKAIRKASPWSSVFVQVLDPGTRSHGQWAQWDIVLCL